MIARHSLPLRCAAATLLTLIGSAHATQASHYHDGTSRRPITLDTGWVAQIVMPSATDGAPERSASPSASPLVRLHRVDPSMPRTALRGPTSPVYREGTSTAGRLMTLPGGVLVKVNPAWSDAAVRTWATSRGLQIIRRLRADSPWHLLACEPGPASLELANELHTSGEVLAAIPNWWKQTTPR